MDLDDIPADKIITLTEELNRLFKAARCYPTCHACRLSIKINEKFQLLSFDGRDQMVCHRCDRTKLEEQKKALEKWRDAHTSGGYSRLSIGGSDGSDNR